MKEQKLLTYLRKCADDYRLISEGDRIAVGLSGGKDSYTLLYGLNRLKSFYPKSFSLQAIAVDSGFGMDYTPAADFCGHIGVPFSLCRTEIADIVFSEGSHQNPCSLCANMRRGALTGEAERLGANKLALGHHRDDLLSTLLLSLLYEGRFYSFAPVTHYEDRNLDIIRPMLCVPEGAISNFADEMRFPLIKNLCPRDHLTKREEMNRLIRALSVSFPDIRERLFHAVISSDIPDWAAARQRKEQQDL